MGTGQHPFPVAPELCASQGAPCVGWVSPFVHGEARCCGHASRWSWSLDQFAARPSSITVDAGPLVAGGWVSK